ncbi:hypothetical protein ACPA0F_18130 [Solibacillus silvestris]
MYVEGKCLAKNLVPSIVKHITDATDATGNKLWEMISSKVGVRTSSVYDDGWVFKSKGTSGNDNLIIGFPNGQRNNSSWLFGNGVFVAIDYQKGADGENGKFTGKQEQSMPLFGLDWNGYSPDNLPMRYYLSITKDRVIIAYFSDVLHSYSRSNLVYLGKPAWTSNPNDRGIVIASGIDESFRSTSVIMTDPYQVGTGTEYYLPRAEFGDQARGWGGKLYPSRLSLVSNSSTRGGVRGILDLLVVKQDGQFRKIDTVKIGDLEFLCVEIPYITALVNTTSYPNSLQPDGSSSTLMVYMFPKI